MANNKGMANHQELGDLLTIVFGMVGVALAVFAVVSILKMDVTALFSS